MTASPFDSALFGPLFGDEEVRALVCDEACIRAMLRVEAALARAEARAGVISNEAAEAIAAAAGRLVVAPTDLAEETARDGVPIPALARRLRREVGGTAADAVHLGATSQDIVDTALVLTTDAALHQVEVRLRNIVERLTALAEVHAETPIAGRTRFQLASPTTFGLKLVGWAAPLQRHRARLAELRPRFRVASLAGASGNLAALGRHGPAVEAFFAEELGLRVAAAPWHAARDTVAEVGGWLSLVTGSLGKLGLDVLLLAQNEVAEARPSGGGGSSAMPHKANPVAAETLVMLARVNADRLATLHHALLHAHERDGGAWLSEWATLPEMTVAAAGATRTALALVEGLAVDAAAMRARLDDAPGLLHSEPALVALKATMTRGEAEAAVADTAGIAVASGRRLVDVLAERLPEAADWDAVRRLDVTIATAAARTRAALARLAQDAAALTDAPR